jgi:hypothetical protein
MNNSNAAAKKRRAGILPNTPPTESANKNPTNTSATNGLTLTQVIAVIDQRLINLETFMNNSKNGESDTIISDDIGNDSAIVMDSKEFTSFVDEINSRFQILADEMNTLKDTILKLQTYTMDVNKILLNEITKNEGGEMPNITLGENENVVFMLESMKDETIV